MGTKQPQEPPDGLENRKRVVSPPPPPPTGNLIDWVRDEVRGLRVENDRLRAEVARLRGKRETFRKHLQECLDATDGSRAFAGEFASYLPGWRDRVRLDLGPDYGKYDNEEE